MPKLARDYGYSNYTDSYAQNNSERICSYSGKIYHYPIKNKTKIKVKRKKNPWRFLLSSLILGSILMIFMPYSFSKITKSVFVPKPYKSITPDLHSIAFPTTNYLANNWYMGKRKFSQPASYKDAQMIQIQEGVVIPSLQNELLKLSQQYKMIHPAIYVWDYETQNYIDINSSEVFSAASIIKIPVLIDLFKSVENGTISLDDTIPLTEYYRSEGSGSLQYKATDSKYTIDKLAEIMITESDNSATNMLMSQIGGVNNVNQSIRDWGLKNTEVKTWLPDLKGNNHTTAREMGQMLYNIDSNEKFLSEFSRKKIFDYMGHVKNDRLIQAGLGAGSTFLHKTGDIGSMLGDAGIVTTPNSKKYIAVIMANRPHNDPKAAEFIVKASEIIYNYMVK